jgi:ammonia channel protein AmtB
VGKQLVLAGVTVGFSFAATMLILKVTELTVGLHVSEEHEDVGLDASQHDEVGYPDLALVPGGISRYPVTYGT